jgi:signal transduction histidine kinase
MTIRHLIVILLFGTQLISHAFSQTVQNGVAYFPEKEHKNQDAIFLSGSWHFFYGKHLSASEMEHLKPDETYFLAAPSNWKNLIRRGEKTPAIGIATYFLKIIVDTNKIQSPRNYAFYIADITSAYTVYVNGLPVMNVGNASSVRNGFKPGYYPHVGFFQTNEDTLNVVIHVSNFFYPHFSGISRPIIFGQEKSVSREQLLITAASILLLCIFGAMFLFEFLVYIVYPKQKSHLWIGVLALIFIIKMLLDSEMTIFHFFPAFNYKLGYRFWLLCLNAIPVLYCLIRKHFPIEMNRWAILMVQIIFGVYSLAIITLPLTLTLEYLMPIFYFSMVSVVYLLWVVAHALINQRRYALIHLISFIFALACFLYDLFAFTEPNNIHFVSQLGICQFLMIQSLLTIFQFIGYHKMTLTLSKELEATNQGLEETVKKRTLELQLTNSKLEKINNQKNFMLATTTHDLKNSFNILINCSQIMYEDKALTQDQQLYASMIRDASNDGYRVLQNILSWARMQITDYSGTNVIHDLRGLAVMEVDTFKYPIKDKDLHVRVEVDNNLLFVCDEEQLYSICRNILSNAIKFSKTGGEITISNLLVENMVEIRFHDDGIGMESQMVETIFDNTIDNTRHGTSGESGSGLGLLIVKELVESNKGTISCSSTLGKETDFIIQFPSLGS